jgi:NADPH:quinone reductase-like Zn-dependent oxidoreductase
MKAVVLTEYGDIDKLLVRDVPNPHPAPDAIVVRMASASINPIDWKMRSGAARERFPVELPGILGRDAAGEVVELGANVRGFRIGDRVLGLVNGAYAERVTAPASAWVKIPPGLGIVEAGALPLVLLTGAQLMEEAVDPKRGDHVLVTGAVGSVGRVAVHAAKMRGARVWAGIRASQRAQADELGATGVVALDDESDRRSLPMLDGIADTVGGELIKHLYDKLQSGGTIGSVVGDPPGARERGFVVRALTARMDAAMLTRYAEEVARGRLVIPIAERVPLVRAPEAQAFAETKHPHGKVLLLG